MQSVLRPALFLALLAASAAGLVACGGEDAAEQDVDTLLEQTFSGQKDVKSGRLQLKASFEGEGGPATVELSGPFEDQGDKLPKLDLDLSFQGGGQSLTAGLTSTGDKGFVTFQGTDYAVSDEVFQEVQKAYTEAQKQAGDQQDVSLQTLGLDPRTWLTGARNEGEAKVGDTDVVKITGGVDVPRLLDDLNEALAKAGRLGLQGQDRIPTQLSEQQRRQLEQAVEDVRVEIYTGADDKILRRMLVTLNVDARQAGSGKVTFDLSLLELNEGQEIEEPESPKPFEELLQQIGGLGGLLGAGGGQGAGSGSGGAAGGDAQSQEQLEEFTRCLEEAGSDQAAAQKCSELIAP